MCYTPKISLSFALAGIGALIYVLNVPSLLKNNVHILLIFYILMELLQTVSYYYANECDNKINKFLTEIAYVFVITQPLLWNSWFYLNTATLKSEKPLFMCGIVLSLVWIIFNVLGRLVYTPSNAQTFERDSFFASSEVCTRKKATHLFWTWPSANMGNYNANFLMHMMIWMIPGLVSVTHRFKVVILLFSAILSSLYALSVNEPFVMTAAWCYISIPIVFIILMNPIS